MTQNTVTLSTSQLISFALSFTFTYNGNVSVYACGSDTCKKKFIKAMRNYTKLIGTNPSVALDLIKNLENNIRLSMEENSIDGTATDCIGTNDIINGVIAFMSDLTSELISDAKVCEGCSPRVIGTLSHTVHTLKTNPKLRQSMIKLLDIFTTRVMADPEADDGDDVGELFQEIFEV